MQVNNHKKLKAFSLLNILGAIFIMGLISLMVVPNIMKSVVKAKKLEAKQQLAHVYTLQRTYFFEFAKYSTDLEAIDFEQSTLVTEGGNAKYKIEIVEASNVTFLARAVAVQDFDGDGVFNIWEVNHENKVVETQDD